MKILRIFGLLALLSLSASGGIAVAATEPAIARSDLAEYVYLHETRNQSIPLQIAARATNCRGTPVAARN